MCIRDSHLLVSDLRRVGASAASLLLLVLVWPFLELVDALVMIMNDGMSFGFSLDEPFMVIATQNPIEQEGTYPLPEAQIDRFMLKLHIDYPSKEEEKLIMQQMSSSTNSYKVKPVVDPEDILAARKVIDSIYIDENLQDYIINLVTATRDPKGNQLSSYAGMIQFGASPRASIFLNRAAKAFAFLQRRGYVVPQDIKSIGMDVLRHRVILTYEAEAENVTADDILKSLFDTIEVP